MHTLLVLAASAILDSSTPLPLEGLELRLMSFNIRYGTARDGADAWEHRREMVFDIIRRHEPDALGLQEALRFQMDEIRRQFPVYGEIGAGRDDGAMKGEYSAILYRSDRFRQDDGGTFWLSDTPTVPGSRTWGNWCARTCTWARLVDLESGKAFYHYNVHLDHLSQRSRERGLELVARVMQARPHLDPAVLTGDFNAGETNPAVKHLKDGAPSLNGAARPLSLVDTFRVAHPGSLEVGTFHAFTGRRTGSKIDFVFAPAAARVLDAAIVRDARGGRYPSDHYPVTARIVLPAAVRDGAALAATPAPEKAEAVSPGESR